MKYKYYFIEILLLVIIFASASFSRHGDQAHYASTYSDRLQSFEIKLSALLDNIEKNGITSGVDKEIIRNQICLVRNSMKGLDFWLRYLEPVSYKKINGPLPVEWETEVFEKFEKPYKRVGAGLTLASVYLDEEEIQKDSLSGLIRSARDAAKAYGADSATRFLKESDHFFLCNRLFLLNLATIYTSGFDCPDTSRIIPELRLMLGSVYTVYTAFNSDFEVTRLTEDYMTLYKKTVDFANRQSENYSAFDHFTFIKDYINPLFTINQDLIRKYDIRSRSYMDYSLNRNATSIFSKNLYNGQNTKGLFLRVHDPKALSEIEEIGKLLFYDPILSGNNLRSCASCHKPDQLFTDTTVSSNLQFNKKGLLDRNTPSLVNTQYNHLLMADGKHISLQEQAHAVISSSLEMACDEKEMLKKVLSCNDYNTAFKKFLKYTPQEPEISAEHIVSALTLYYSKFSRAYSPFDEAINSNKQLNPEAKKGYNVFMSKAQCGTCHFAPQFNGVKPPYIGSEFEVLGVPEDSAFTRLSEDVGRYFINPALETTHAFRTVTIRNAQRTAPYMHNGVFTHLAQVIDFYEGGGGAGRGLKVDNQTLSADSLRLSKEDKKHLLAFIHSLNETVAEEKAPEKLPASKIKTLNNRKVGGEY